MTELIAETTNGFVNFSSSLKKDCGRVLRPGNLFKFEIALNAALALDVRGPSNPDAEHAQRRLNALTEM